MIDRLLVNANIYTLAGDNPRATVVALWKGEIVAVGDDRLRSLATADTVIDDLEGAMLLPGLTDAHVHWQWTSSALNDINLQDVPSKQEILRLVIDAANRAQPGEWVVGRGWTDFGWADGDAPTAADLDAIALHNPVYLSSRSGHSVWVNTMALRRAGITDQTADPVGGKIQRDAAGHATGIFLEAPASRLVESHIPPLSGPKLAELMEHAQRLAWQHGLTGFHDYDNPDAFEAMQLLHEQGKLGLRIVKNINKPYIEHALKLRLRWGFGDEWLRLGGLKIFADGALGARSASMFEPYNEEPQNRGIVVTDKEEIYELASTASRAGFPSTIHAIGDKALHDVLDVYEAVRRDEAEHGIRRTERRHRIEHVQLTAPQDARRLGELDIIASMQPIHATSDYPMADRYWGPERTHWSYNPRLQLDAGARIAFGSDAPVESFEPLRGIHAAVTRRRADGTPGPKGWHPEARITVDEAIRGYTQGPAYAGGMETRLGKIAPGYLADLVALDRDLYTIPPDELLSAQIVSTMVGGVWRWGKFAG